MKVTKLAPLRHEQVAIFVERSAVRRVADAFFPLIGRQPEVGALRRIRVVPTLNISHARLQFLNRVQHCFTQ